MGEWSRPRRAGWSDPGRRPGRRGLGPAVALLWLLPLAWLWPAPVAAVDVDEPEQPLSISTARVDDYPRVSLTVDAPTGAAGTPVPDEAFALLEDGVERDLEVQQLRSEDLEVVLLLDTSGSMEGAPLQAAQAAVEQFVTDMPAQVPVSVVQFASEAAPVSDFTTDRDQTVAAVDEVSAGGWTAMYDALHLAVDLLDERGPDRRAIVLLSDGGDNRSDATLEATVERLRGGEEVVHVIELITADRPDERERFGRDDPDIDEIDLAALRSLADAAGQGSLVSPEDLDAVGAAYRDIATSLMNQYELTYTSEASGSARVTVQLDLDDAVVEGTREVDLPRSDPPVEAEPTPGDNGEPDPGDDGQDAATPSAADEAGPPGPNLLEEPWVLWAVGGLLALGLGYFVFYVATSLRWRL